MKVVFLTFANDQLQPLPNLSKEDDGVFSALVNRSLKGHYFIHRDSFATVEKINQFLGKYGDRLSLFLYSGHADGRSLQLDGTEANANGIAYQLGESARKGNLKLVVLNGCSTGGQVNALLKAGVPAVVATSAPVEDKSATEFSLRFFQCLAEKRLTIRQAFEEAIGAAQTATDKSLDLENIARAGRQASGESGPVWGLFCTDPSSIEINPLPMVFSGSGNPDFIPNEKLTQTLFDSLLNAGCRDIRNIHEKEEEGEYVEIGDIQTTIVNVLPYPIGIHLQKLLCPVEQENEGFDKISLRRLEQIGIVFHTTVEFMAFVMLAQLWEIKLQNVQDPLPEHLIDSLRDYFYMSPAERSGFDYFPFIRNIRRYFDTIHDGRGVEYFITELKELKELFEDDKPLATAFDYLVNLRRQTLYKNIAQADVPDMCEEAENKLCTFFKPLGFLHRYVLTSVQNIDIRKDRYQLIPAYNHAIVKLMRAFGKPEHNYYILSHFLDNRGVILVKGKLRVLDRQKKEFTGDDIDFLNLSPFVIDRNAFEDNTDLSNLLFFEQYRKNEDKYIFKNVKQPDSMRDRLEVSTGNSFEAVYLQMDAFRSLILNETTKNVSHV